MTDDRLRAYLADDERLRGRWTGSVRGVDGRRATAAVIGATDRRLVWLTDRGRFGAVALDSVSGLETARRTRPSYEGLDYRLAVGAGLALAAGCFLAAVAVDSGVASLLLILGSVGGIAVAEYAWRHREDFDGVRRVETDVRHIAVTGADGRTRELSVPTGGPVDAEVSRLVFGAGAGDRSARDPEGGSRSRSTAGRR